MVPVTPGRYVHHMVKPWRCPNCRSRTGVPVRYGLPTLETADMAARGEVVLGGCVLGDDDPPRCCTSCRAALWPGGVFATPGAGDDRRIVLRRTLGGRRLEASVDEHLDLTLAWSDAAGEETLELHDGQLDLFLVFLLGRMLGDGARLVRWLRRNGVEFVGAVDGPVDRVGFTPDGMLTMSGPSGDLLVHSTLERLVLAAVSATFRRNGYRSITEFREWLATSAASFLRSL